MAIRAMTVVTAVLAALLASGADAAGSRALRATAEAAGAPSAAAFAPGPMEGAPRADILFTLAAPHAELSAHRLVLKGVAPVVQSFTHMGETDVFSTKEFANGSADGMFVAASGAWLHDPVAVLKAMAGEQPVSALVALAEPMYNASAHTLSFRAGVLPATGATILPAAGGAAGRLVDDAANGIAAGVLAEAPADTALTRVGLFIDASSMSLGGAGIAERGGGGGGHGGGGGGGHGGGFGGGGGHGGGYGGGGSHGYGGGHGGGGYHGGGYSGGGDYGGSSRRWYNYGNNGYSYGK